MVTAMAMGQPTTKECPLIPGCCEEDCCGKNTSWDVKTQYCVADPDSTGFNGTHSSKWEPGCVERVCCGQDCCSSDTVYDEETALCLSAIQDSYISASDNDSEGRTESIAESDVTDILLSMGSSCADSEECETGYCHNPIEDNRDPTCTCNPATNEGCTGDFVCIDSAMIRSETDTELRQPAPTCYLPPGAQCEPSTDDGQCLTYTCNPSTSTCGCNEYTDYPCNGNEICSRSNDDSVCLPANIYTLEPGEEELFGKDVIEIINRCTNGHAVYLKRNWPIRVGRSRPRTNKRSLTLLCSSQPTVKADNTYLFTLNDERTISIKCPVNSTFGNAVCSVKGNGLLSVHGEGCMRDTDCLESLYCAFSDTWYLNRGYVGVCVDEEDY